MPPPGSDDVEWEVYHGLRKKLTIKTGHKVGNRSKGAHEVTGYSKTKGRDRLLSTSIHTFLVGKGKENGSNEGNKI